MLLIAYLNINYKTCRLAGSKIKHFNKQNMFNNDEFLELEKLMCYFARKEWELDFCEYQVTFEFLCVLVLLELATQSHTNYI